MATKQKILIVDDDPTYLKLIKVCKYFNGHRWIRERT